MFQFSMLADTRIAFQSALWYWSDKVKCKVLSHFHFFRHPIDVFDSLQCHYTA